MMKPQHLLLLLPLVEGYVPKTVRNAFLHGQQKLKAATMSVTPPLSPMPQNAIVDQLARDVPVGNLLPETDDASLSTSCEDLRQMEAVHGMPWKSSIDERVTDDELLYMPFWEWQMQFMEDNLSNVQVEPCDNGKTDFSYNANTKKKARIVNLCLSSDEYRKIRLTYYDAGDSTQVFNSVFYPRPEYNLPVLGIDLLAFNRKKYLAIVDFQPIHDTEEDHAARYEHLLQPIKRSYESLQGQMSAKFYDETKFFSKQMLFARFEDEKIVSDDLFPAYQRYVETHLNLVKSLEPNHETVPKVMERQREYDIYSAERDPAAGLFTAMYGAEWAEEFMHDFLFSMSGQAKAAASKQEQQRQKP